jgi:glycerophosphoryl diester phosphodiesterase
MMEEPSMIVVGHRGAALLEPENTLRGFRRAIALGVDFVECDVHLTTDGQLAVIHDDTVDRTTDGHGPVSGFSMEELRRLDAGQGERIPTLEQVLAVTRDRVRVLIELKGAGVEAAAVATVNAVGLGDQVILTSFHLERIRKARDLDPGLTTGAIFSQPPPDACAQATAAGATTMGVHHRNLTADLLREAQAAGFIVRAWNPDTEPEIEAMVDLGVDGIGSNRPDLLLEVVRRRGLR